MNGYFLASVVIVCVTIKLITEEILEQRRRETKTGEFKEDQEDE